MSMSTGKCIGLGCFCSFVGLVALIIVFGIVATQSSESEIKPQTEAEIAIHEAELKKVETEKSALQIADLRKEAESLKQDAKKAKEEIEMARDEKVKLEGELTELRSQVDAEKAVSEGKNVEKIAQGKGKDSIKQLEKRAEELSKKIAKSKDSLKLQEEYNRLIKRRNELRIAEKQNKEEVKAEKLSVNANEGRGGDKILTSNPVFKKVNSEGDYTTYSWKVDIENPFDEDREVFVLFKILDAEGFVVDDTHAVKVIPAKKTVTVSDKSMVDKDVFKKAKSCEASIEE